jgi:hypothetical protein
LNSSRKNRLRFLLLNNSNPVVPRLICFMLVVFLSQSSDWWVMRSFPKSTLIFSNRPFPLLIFSCRSSFTDGYQKLSCLSRSQG